MVKVMLSILLFLVGCSPSKFSIIKQPNLSNKLKLNGCYYNYSFNGNQRYVHIDFFYTNGVIFSQGLVFENLVKGLDYYRNLNNNTRYKNSIARDRTSWGLYKIINDQIIIEEPEPKQGGPMHKLNGRIINDTTFIIETFQERGIVSKAGSLDYFYFKQFEMKPDSSIQSVIK